MRGSTRGRFAERAAARRVGPGRARKHLVPRAEARALAIHPHAQRLGDSWRASDRRRRPSARRARRRAPTPTRSALAGVESLSASALLEQPVGVVGGRADLLRRAPPPREPAAHPSSSSSDDVLPGRGLDRADRAARSGTDRPRRRSDTRASRSPSTSNRAVHSSVPGATSVIGVSRQLTLNRRARRARRDHLVFCSAISACSAVKPCRSRSTAAMTS